MKTPFAIRCYVGIFRLDWKKKLYAFFYIISWIHHGHIYQWSDDYFRCEIASHQAVLISTLVISRDIFWYWAILPHKYHKSKTVCVSVCEKKHFGKKLFWMQTKVFIAFISCLVQTNFIIFVILFFSQYFDGITSGLPWFSVEFQNVYLLFWGSMHFSFHQFCIWCLHVNILEISF